MTTFRYSCVAEVMQYFEVEADTEQEALEELEANPAHFLIYTEEEPVSTEEFNLTELGE